MTVDRVGRVIEPRRYRDVMGKFATGVSVVSFLAQGQPAGLTANAFTSVSLDPPLVLLSIRNQSRFFQSVALGDRYAISMLAHDQHPTSDHFGGRPGPSGGPDLHVHDGVPLVRDCVAWLIATAVDIHPAGDHRLVIGRVEQLDETASAPLVYFGGRYRQLGEAIA